VPFLVAALREKIRIWVTLKSIACAECAAGGVMENGMPRIRIATAGASILFFLAVTLGSAAAQSETTGPVGKPLPLLQFTQHKGKMRPPLHPKLAAVVEKKKKPFRERIARHVAAKPHRAIVDARPAPAPAPPPVPVASAAMPENGWPTASAGPPDAMLTPDQPPPSVTTEPTVNADPDQIVTGGHSVQAALPNGLDQAAHPAAPMKTQVKTTATASAAPAPVVHAMVVRAEPRNSGPPSPIGSASWIEHVLAALGGAIAAGAVAWFLINPAPERRYG
jgi:hypothetical protein